MKFYPLLCMLFALPAQAAELSCRADFDESSHYELAAKMNEKNEIAGDIAFAFITDDGMDMSAKMKPTEQKFEAERALYVSAANDRMKMAANLAYRAKDKIYSGVLEVYFDLDSVDSLELDVDCALK